jgi:RNA polymerase sigma factor (sigma-70 family)
MEVSALTHPSSIPGLRGPSALLRLQSDERLIALTRRGQHAAFEVLCDRYQSRLLSFCKHMLASREDAEDVLQEVFAAAFNAVLADEREINVRPWLYRIARNRSLNHLRRASAIGVDSMDVHYAEQGISTGEKVLRRESFRELIEDVHELPETQRTALLLREIDALSYEQIAHAMETTVPSVKSLLVRARISLAEAAEARKLSCEEVRLELGTAAEGLAKLSTPARRHVRGCERCSAFKKHLKDNNHALALIMPVGPLLLFKKLLLAKLGSTASAGGAHVAGGAGVSGAGVSAAGVGAGATAAGGSSVAGGLVTAGAGALATKAVAGLAAAAIVTAGAVAADNVAVAHRHHHPHAALTASVPSAHYAPVVVRQALQPVSAGAPAPKARSASATHRVKLVKAGKSAAAPSAAAAAPGAVAAPAPAVPVKSTPQPVTQGSEVAAEATTLPPAATTTPAAAPAPPTTTPPTTTTPPPATATTPTSTTPTAPAEEPPAVTVPVPAPASSGESPPAVEAPSLPDTQSTGGTEAPGSSAAAAE